MNRSPSLAASILLLPALCGCERQSSLISQEEPIAFRVFATMNSDAKTVETANLISGRFVTMNGEVIAEWVPVRDDVNNIRNAVTRQAQTHTEVLVLCSANDITNIEIASIEVFTDSNSRNQTLITLTDEGSRKLFSFTVEHVGHVVAVVASGEIRAVPQIVSPVRNEMVLSPDRIDKVRVVRSAAK